DLDIDQHIIFGGAAADTRPFYCASDVFVLPTKFDPFANTTNEALASGLPVITTHTNGASEILTPKEGYVVERSTDIEELSAAMRALLDKERCATMSANARQTALLHPWSQTANKTLEVYEEILRERQTSHD
ncbi:MAG: glycosyltransferase, partial [Armatimonadetes bacterium]|nr:glycosyltransferase [Armatimonadota bacterium]NIM23627.1 glycosyltransferase [Armatimonadota bacterium]NIM67494.1 glycosyltransferase [Armatimonadota bacterium]NIM75990.1 glycosyltransferase [Armatimonadota bacterium]NIN05679.1 glycosyltransferase [Armatimonadota bacterium]